MKTHAPSGKKRNARLATATIALFAALAPASAWALDMPVPAGDQSCPATGIETVAPLQVAVQTKSEAILGGTRSKLEELKAQQAAAAAAAITPAPAPMVQLAMLSPAAGPAPVAAPCTAMAFARLPQMAQETTLAPRALRNGLRALPRFRLRVVRNWIRACCYSRSTPASPMCLAAWRWPLVAPRSTINGSVLRRRNCPA